MNAYRVAVRCYVSRGGNNKIAEWYSDLSGGEKADADEFLTIMRKVPFADWKMNEYRPRLKGKARYLGELRWKSENKQHRLIGFFFEGIWYAVMGCIHKQNIYNPADALVTSERRRREILNKEVNTVEYDV
jgi:hypothetical protein